MIGAIEDYHPQIARAIMTMAMFEARKDVKRNIQREGRVKLSTMPVREITTMDLALIAAHRDEYIAPRP